MVIIVLGIAIPTSIYVLGALTGRSVEAEKMTVATNLAQRLMEEIRSKGFNEVAGRPQSPIPNFDKFSSEVEVFYVQGTDLDTKVSFVTDYKRVRVTIITPEGGRINLVTLVGGY